MDLSGGNQQKFILARTLAANCKVLILCEPTRGIDVGAKAEIYKLLSDLSGQGYAILVISSELPEIISICYRTLVIYQGRVTGNILHDEMDENLIMRCATGAETWFSEGAEL
jgi:ABC-type sugar transport system ATPase subunit